MIQEEKKKKKKLIVLYLKCFYKFETVSKFTKQYKVNWGKHGTKNRMKESRRKKGMTGPMVH